MSSATNNQTVAIIEIPPAPHVAKLESRSTPDPQHGRNAFRAALSVVICPACFTSNTTRHTSHQFKTRRQRNPRTFPANEKSRPRIPSAQIFQNKPGCFEARARGQIHRVEAEATFSGTPGVGWGSADRRGGRSQSSKPVVSTNTDTDTDAGDRRETGAGACIAASTEDAPPGCPSGRSGEAVGEA